MNPSASAISTLQTYVATLSGGWSGNTDAQIVATLNSPAVANPVAQGTIAVPFTRAQLLGALSVTSLLALRNYVGVTSVIADVDSGDVGKCNSWIQVLAASTGTTAAVITSSEASALTSIVNATVPDPSWQAQISWAQQNLGRSVDANDIAESRPS